MNVIGTNDVNAGNLIFASGNNSSIIFNKLELTPLFTNLLGWYSSDFGVYNSPGVLATNGQTVRTWENKLNNGINLSQNGNINLLPVYINNAIKFTQNSMSGIAPISLNSPLSYYLATQTTLSGSSSLTPFAAILKQDVGAYNLSSTNKYVFCVDTGSQLAARTPNTFLSNKTTLNGTNIIYINFSGSTNITIGDTISNVNTTSAIISSNTSNTFVLGSYQATSSEAPLQGSIYEILIYTGVHTTSEVNQILNYLVNKWG